MIDYEPVEPPLWNTPINSSDREQKEYFDWFVSAIPERMNQLQKLVCSNPGFEEWGADRGPESLPQLAVWLYSIVKAPSLLAVEDQVLNKKLEVLRYQWLYRSLPQVSVMTISAAFDVGIYLGEVFRHKYTNVDWWLCKMERNVYHGEPVLMNFGVPQVMSPISMVRGQVTAIIDNHPAVRPLDEIYQY